MQLISFPVVFQLYVNLTRYEPKYKSSVGRLHIKRMPQPSIKKPKVLQLHSTRLRSSCRWLRKLLTGGLLTGEKFVGVLLTCEKLHHDVKPGITDVELRQLRAIQWCNLPLITTLVYNTYGAIFLCFNGMFQISFCQVMKVQRHGSFSLTKYFFFRNHCL